MSSRGRRLRRRQHRRGATLVEFAMVIPVVLLVLFGMIEISRLLMVQHALSNAAQRGARQAMLAVTLDGSDVEDAVRGYLDAALGSVADDSDAVRITVSPETLAGLDSGTEVNVQIQVGTSHISWFNGNGFLGISEVTLSGQSTRIRE